MSQVMKASSDEYMYKYKWTAILILESQKNQRLQPRYKKWKKQRKPWMDRRMYGVGIKNMCRK